MQFHAKYPLFDSQSDSGFTFSYVILLCITPYLLTIFSNRCFGQVKTLLTSDSHKIPFHGRRAKNRNLTNDTSLFKVGETFSIFQILLLLRALLWQRSANVQFAKFKTDFLGNQSEYRKSRTHFRSVSPPIDRKAGNSI